MAGYPGKQGRKPTPTALRLLRGNPSKRPLPEHEPRVAPKLPTPPKELSDAAKREWRRTGRKLLAIGVITELDTAAFAAYCQTYAQWLDVQDKIGRTGALVKDGKGGYKLNPLHRLARDLEAQWMKALSEFGMTPSSRTRVQASKPAQHDPLEEFLSGSRRTS